PIQEGPLKENETPGPSTIGKETSNPLQNIYNQLSDQLEAKVLHLASNFQHTEESEDSTLIVDLPFEAKDNSAEDPVPLQLKYHTSRSYSLTIHIDSEEIKQWTKGYSEDPYFKKVIETLQMEENLLNPKYPQYFVGDNGLIYFEDWEGNMRLCVPQAL